MYCSYVKEPECPLGYVMEMIDSDDNPFNIMFMPGDNDVTPEDILPGADGSTLTSDETIVIKPTTIRGEMIVLDVSLDVKGPADVTIRVIFSDSTPTVEQSVSLQSRFSSVLKQT